MRKQRVKSNLDFIAKDFNFKVEYRYEEPMQIICTDAPDTDPTVYKTLAEAKKVLLNDLRRKRDRLSADIRRIRELTVADIDVLIHTPDGEDD